MSEKIKCNICGHDTKQVEVKEQMLGMSEKFMYYMCINCGHTHLENIPEDLGKYYNIDSYYSFTKQQKEKSIGNAIQKILLKFNSTDNMFFSRSMQSFLKAISTNTDLNILDYGCGSGYFVDELQQLGFRSAKGYDPFLPLPKTNSTGVYLSNNLDVFAIKKWDIITLNHVFEHLIDPVQVLQDLKNLLTENGLLVLRFPVIDSHAFDKYQENWVQFDAPRHINLFTRKSIRLAVDKATGFEIVKLYDDSFHFQFTGSELYMKNNSLSPANNNRRKRLLSLSTYQYHFLAKKLNRKNQGDQIVIILKKNT